MTQDQRNIPRRKTTNRSLSNDGGKIDQGAQRMGELDEEFRRQQRRLTKIVRTAHRRQAASAEGVGIADGS